MENRGLLFFNNKDYFLNETRKAFCRERIISFLNDKGIALFDTASAIRRLQDNASDKFLEVVQPTDISRLLGQLPECKAIVTTGQKATDTLRAQFEVEEPKVGDFSEFVFDGLPDALIPHAFFFTTLSVGTRQKSGSIPHHVSRFTNA